MSGGGTMLVEPGRSITYSLYAPESVVPGLSFVESFAALDALCPQLVVDVVALQRGARLVQPRAAVELVASGFDHGRQVDATAGNFRAAADGADRRLFDRCVVPVVRVAAPGLQNARLHPLERGVCFPRLPEYPIGRHLVDTAPANVSQRTHARRLGQQADDAVAARGEELDRLARKLRRRGRRFGVNDRRGARHGDRFLECADFQLHVDSCSEPDREPHPLVSDSLESRQRVFNGVGADGKRRQPVIAPFVGDAHDGRHLQGRAGGCDRYARQYRSAFVRHLTDDTGFLLSGGRPSGQHY